MPRDSCDPCCNPTELARGVEMYRSAVLQILCMISDEISVLVTGGVPVEATELSITLNTVSQEMLAANPARAPGSWVKNTGVLNGYVSLSNLATAGSPSLVPPGGRFDIPDNYYGDVSGVTLSGTTSFDIVELTEIP